MTTTTSRSAARYPTRIVCLTEETTEALYLLGEESRIVGISGFTVRPPRARKEKPKVSAFISAKIDRILALEPDLVLGFSDLQADIASQLIRHGVEVHVFNQRSVDEILRVIRMLGGMIGCEAKADALAAELENGLDTIRATAARFRAVRVSTSKSGTSRRSRASAGCRNSSALRAATTSFRNSPLAASARTASSPTRSKSCGARRTSCSGRGAARNSQHATSQRDQAGTTCRPCVTRELHEVKSSIILQPGPAALTDGVRELHRVIAAWVAKRC